MVWSFINKLIYLTNKVKTRDVANTEPPPTFLLCTWSSAPTTVLYSPYIKVGKYIELHRRPNKQRLNNWCTCKWSWAKVAQSRPKTATLAKLWFSRGMVFCFQDCSDPLWEKTVLVIKNKFSWGLLRALQSKQMGGWHLRMTWGQEVCYTSLHSEPASALSLLTVWSLWGNPGMARCWEMATFPAEYILQRKLQQWVTGFHCVCAVL